MSTNRRPKAPKRDIPDHWRILMDRKGINSIRTLAVRANIDHMTTTRVVFGDKEPSERIIQAIAGALDLDMPTAYRLMGQPAKYAEQWTPPAESARMSPEQRRVVEDLIRVFVDEGQAPRTVIHPEKGGYDLAAYDRPEGVSPEGDWEG